MTANLRPYPELVESGREWLGEVPSHWELLPNRAVFSEVKECGHSQEKMLAVTIEKGVVSQQHLLENTTSRDTSSLDKSSYKLVRPGDIAYNKMRAWQGALGASSLRGIISPAYVVHRPKPSADSRFLHYAFRTTRFLAEAERWSYGITSDMWSLRPEHFKLIYTALPPLEEQTAIARFLDYIDCRITRHIHAKEKLVALLEEYKQAVIHQAVTGQIDVRTGKTYAKYKDSGLEWLGKVPEHWNIVALRHRYRQCLGKMLDSKKITGEHLTPYLRNTDVQWDRIDVSDLPHMDVLPDELERYTVSTGDLLVCEGGEVGRCAVWEGQLHVCAFQKALHRLRPFNVNRDRPRYMLHCLRVAVQRAAFNDGHESTIGHLTREKLRAHRFPFPPTCEQKAIAQYIDELLQRVEDATAKLGKLTAGLQEYRTRLIADVVTGKLDVREAAAKLPDSDPLESAPGLHKLPCGEGRSDLVEDADLT